MFRKVFITVIIIIIIAGYQLYKLFRQFKEQRSLMDPVPAECCDRKSGIPTVLIDKWGN